MWLLFSFVLIFTCIVGFTMSEVAKKTTQFFNLNTSERKIVEKEVNPIHKVFLVILFCIWAMSSALFLILIMSKIG
jgi:cytochrome oxidase Cu insertion factor (SCO1/SenC/PrrC family)